MNFSAEQFETLMTVITNRPATAADTPAPNSTKNDPAALGPIRQCSLGSDKMQKLNLFNEWIEGADNRMNYIGITEDKEKIILLKTWGGLEMIELIRTCNSHLNTHNNTQVANDGDTTLPK